MITVNRCMQRIKSHAEKTLKKSTLGRDFFVILKKFGVARVIDNMDRTIIKKRIEEKNATKTFLL